MTENVFLKKKVRSQPKQGVSLTEAFQAPSGKILNFERTFLEPFKSCHPGSHLWAEERQSLTHLTLQPLCWSPLLPTAPLPRAQGHHQTLLPSQTALHKYLHSSSRGLQQTQHGGATLPTLSRPQRRAGVAHTPSVMAGLPRPQGGAGTGSPKQNRAPCSRSGMTPPPQGSPWSCGGKAAGP